MKELRKKLDYLIKTSDVDPDVIKAIKSESSVPPFTTESRLLAYLLAAEKIDYRCYSDLGKEFCGRNQRQTKYLKLFDMAPRTFGQTWGEQHIRELFPQFMAATKENLSALYPRFDGEFDLWINGIRVEVKACRANSTSTKGSLSSRAYTHEEAKKAKFKYHYQQLKPSCCDVFIWIGVCTDELIYWVLTSEELLGTGKYGPHHRKENTGAEGADVYEGQVFMTEEELRPFWVEEKDILSRVIEKGRK